MMEKNFNTTKTTDVFKPVDKLPQFDYRDQFLA